MIIAQAPKFAPYITQMQATLAKHLGVTPGQVGVKATTSEHLGFTGRKEGITVSPWLALRCNHEPLCRSDIPVATGRRQDCPSYRIIDINGPAIL